jgi:O-antigen/teichoic acid export membrane protein
MGDDRTGQRGVATTAFSTMIVQLTTYGLLFAVSVIIARELGPAGRGAYYVPVAAGAITLVLVHLGLEGSNTYYLANARLTVRQMAAAAALLAPVCGLVGGATLSVIYVLTSDSLFQGVPWAAFVFAPALLSFQLHLLWTTNLFTLAGRVIRAQIAQLLGALCQFALLAPVAFAGHLTLEYALATYAVYILVPWACLAVWARTFAPAVPRFDPAVLRTLVTFGLKLQVAQIFLFLLVRADTLVINAMLGTSDVGIYSLTVLIAEGMILLTTPLVLAILPVQATMDLQDAGRMSFKAARFNGLIALCLAICAGCTMWLVLPLLYGPEFKSAYPALMALMPGVIAFAVARPLGNWLVRHGRPWLLSAFGAIAFAVNMALNVLLLPVVGIVGASVASSAAYIGFVAAMVAWGLHSTGLNLRAAMLPQSDDIASARHAVVTIRDRAQHAVGRQRRHHL